MSGAVPTQLGGLTQLMSMYLNSNSLSGAVPSQLGNVAASSACSLGGTNRFACPLPVGADSCIGNAGNCKTTCK